MIDLPNSRLFCIFDVINNYQIGVCAYRNNQPEHLKIDIGFVWISPIAQGTKSSTKMSYFLLSHAFELGYRRVEWNVNMLNIRSYKYATRIGFIIGLTQLKFWIVKDRSADCINLRILNHEWPQIKKKLEEVLYQN